MTLEVPASRIEALVRLLGDEDQKIHSVAWKHLEQIGDPALRELERASSSSSDPRVRLQAGRFLVEWRRREVFRRWIEFSRRPEIDLEEGAFLIAESEYPDLNVASFRATLDGYAQVLRSRLATARSNDEAVRRTSALLFQELGYRGNTKEYYSPENSYLNRVMETRRGIPISLSVVYLLTARRVGVPVVGVGMPRHFLLKFRGQGHEVFVDAFRSGALLSASDCARLLEESRVELHAEHLRAVSDRQILARMLTNLLRVYHTAEDVRRTDRVSAMLKLLGETSAS